MLLRKILFYVCFLSASSLWCSEVIQDATPSLEIDSIEAFLEKLSSIVPDEEGNYKIPPEILDNLHAVFGRLKGDPKYKDKENLSRIYFMPSKMKKLFESIGKYHIADVSPEVADHLAYAPIGLLGFNDGDTKLFPSFTTMVSFGEDGVPLVLDRLCHKSYPVAYSSDDYFFFSMKYMERVYGKEFVDKIRLLAAEETDVAMRSLLVERILPHAEQYVANLKAKEAREKYRRERKYEGIEKLVTPEQLKRLKASGKIPSDGGGE